MDEGAKLETSPIVDLSCFFLKPGHLLAIAVC